MREARKKGGQALKVKNYGTYQLEKKRAVCDDTHTDLACADKHIHGLLNRAAHELRIKCDVSRGYRIVSMDVTLPNISVLLCNVFSLSVSPSIHSVQNCAGL